MAIFGTILAVENKPVAFEYNISFSITSNSYCHCPKYEWYTHQPMDESCCIVCGKKLIHNFASCFTCVKHQTARIYANELYAVRCNPISVKAI